MRLTLLHNPTAGSGRHDADALRAPLWAAGFDVTYCSTKHDDVARALDRETDLVVVAGGDGTVGDVAKRLAGRDATLAIVPLGTANNVARSLGVDLSPRDALAALHPDRLAAAARRPLYVGIARGPWGETRFIESAGVGLLGTLIREAEATRAPTARGGSGSGTACVDDGRERLRQVLARATPRTLRVEADGEELRGAYLLVEAVSTRFVGPRVALVPATHERDGTLALVLARDADRAALDAHLARRGDDASVAPLETRRARRVRLEWPAALGHVDDERWPVDDHDHRAAEAVAFVDIALGAPPLAVLVPGGA